MQYENPIDNILQLQLSSDALAALYLPSVLSTLSPVHFSSDTKGASSAKAGSGGVNPASSQVPPMNPAILSKWCTRVTSLMQSKDAGARWAGICLARKTGDLRRDVVVEYAQRWINLTLPCLSRTEPLPIWKASIDLLVFIFMATSHLSEFRRQVSTPTVPKLSNALLELSGKGNETLNLLILSSLATLVSTFPTLHRSLVTQITTIIIPFLAGSFPSACSLSLVHAAAHLLATMHHTEGKVGGPLAWRNTLDAVVHEAWKCMNHLQSSMTKDIPPNFTPKRMLELPTVSRDPLVAIQVLLSRLNNMIIVINALFRVNPPRPVLIPIATLAELAIRLLQSTDNVSTSQSQVDVVRIQLEKQAVPELLEAGSTLACILVTSLRSNMTPHATPILSSLAYQLEQDLPVGRRYHLLHTLTITLDHIASHAPLLPARLFRVAVPSLSPLLPSKRAITSVSPANGEQEGVRKGKGKKRMRDFEGDQSLTGGNERSLPMSTEEASVILQALEVLRRVLRMPYLPASLHSLGTRLLLSLHIHITNNTPGSVGMGVATQGTDSTFHAQLQAKLVELHGELSLGTAGYAWRGINLTMQLLLKGDEDTKVSNATRATVRIMDTLIHPRLPAPTLRRLPAPESLMLFNCEESKEEREERSAMGLEDGMRLGMDVELREVAVTEGPLPAREEQLGYRTGQSGDHAMEVEGIPPSKPHVLSPSIPQAVSWQQALPNASPELAIQPDAIMQAPKPFGGFGMTPKVVEEKDANPVQPPPPAFEQHSSNAGVFDATKVIRTVETNERQFAAADMEEMSDEEPIPSIDMGSDSEIM